MSVAQYHAMGNADMKLIIIGVVEPEGSSVQISSSIHG